MISAPADVASHSFVCALCGSTNGDSYTICDLQFAPELCFLYVQCSGCACLQLQNIPENIGQYYPENYYTFTEPPRKSGLRRALRNLRNRGVFKRTAALARALATANPYPLYGAREWFKRIPVAANWKILDVGCGDGMLVEDLSEIGFTRVLGIDPFIPSGRPIVTGGEIRKCQLADANGKFDLIMMHHSLEHIADQQRTLALVAERMERDAWCLIRIPTVSSWAWQHFREHWVQADAPRHLFLHSLGSIEELGRGAGLALVHVDFDSTDFQLRGSELFQRQRSLSDFSVNYPPTERRRNRQEARRLNRQHLGDQIACYFRRFDRS